ncbi:MAG: 1-(5-phosphoribosyl)-5-[(5-phosphoribosylamino)methylideneamino] imidazole-4-carboxamide isomerase [Synergistetes bacterium]|nr:1-(5-phosphoribosyl)-5-[(5-phosphoribosylamino)methylideneamino] imidazole-4-carboxamide isomerase [Synergistota bacterium]MCX8128037.1 1-(5-phosphoribosyl)-5-[(5-phosphoribosylamino)methylideneamino] imidazole-4-carboxamide isomerase [Synergistota bacterium]MDW8193075.1 1-(5-phosphoribosyl)-5-[(5-phosphoribosylamino)methylideneamino] imidazole-4-carboxamide isomerase [Synergistota bacterium]
MLIIPAIDLKDGMCVRLYQGLFERELFRKDPIQMALKFKEAGAKRLHIVDLDGAKEGRPLNLHIALAIKEKTGLEIEIGGGIRNINTLREILSLGMDFAIISTLFFECKESLKIEKSRIIIAIDIDEEGFLKVQGWQKRTNIKGYEFLEYALSDGFENFIITFTHRDGTLKGLDTPSLENFTKNKNSKIIFAGGISSIEDIETAKRVGAHGVIIGRAFYEGTIPLEVIKNVS